MNFKRISSVVYSLFCLSGFLIQVQQVSELYFRFGTTSKTVFQIREIGYYQTMMYCPRFLDILDRSNYKKYGILPEEPKSLQEVLHDLWKLKIKDILDLTPPASEIIAYCYTRHGIVSVPKDMKREECYEFFRVIKSVNGERICYTFMPRNRTSYSASDVASSQTHTNTIYQINVRPSILQTKQAFFISTDINNKTEDAFDSRPFQAKAVNLKTLNESSFSVFGESMEINRLAHPYDTECTPGHDRETCYEESFIKKFKVIDRFS